jgi:hypothetical protein
MSSEVVSVSVEARAVLLELLVRTRAIARRPRPPAWRSWEVERWQDDREWGPLYSPAEWFGGGESIPEYLRVRYLRAIRKLAADGLLTMIMSESGKRLERLRLTEAGQRLAEALARRE